MPSVRPKRTGRTIEEQRKVTVIAKGGSCGLFLFLNKKNGTTYYYERMITMKYNDLEGVFREHEQANPKEEASV